MQNKANPSPTVSWVPGSKRETMIDVNNRIMFTTHKHTTHVGSIMSEYECGMKVDLSLNVNR